MAGEVGSLRAYARHRGCNEKAVRKAASEGRITLVDGKVDFGLADRQWAENTRARGDSAATKQAKAARSPAPRTAAVAGPAARAAPAPGPAPPPEVSDQITYADSRARRENAAAQREELELAKASAKLIDRETVNKAVFETFRALRDRVMAVPRRCAGAVVGLEVREIEQAFADELRKAMGPDEAGFAAALPWKVRP